MHGSYNFLLVVVSFVVATLASYTALDLTSRIALLGRSPQRHAWLAGGAVAMGTGIWSMHFIAMLAFSLPIPLGYDVLDTGYSLALAIVVSCFALFFTTRALATRTHLAISGTLMGCGIAGMHYTGMAAMKMAPGIDYQPGWLAASLAIAIAASIAALSIARRLRDEQRRSVVRARIAAAFVMAMAISGMHYAGMAAADFPPGSVCGAAKGVDSTWLATTVTLFTFAILIATLLLSRIDMRNSRLARAVSSLNGEIVRLATLDTLTGLPNRGTLNARMVEAIDRARRRQTGFAVLFMDLDGFKAINDSLGHSVGDQVLVSFAQRLRGCVRAADTVARLGGDEFVVLVEPLVSPQDARLVAEKVLERTRDGAWSADTPLPVTPSIGIALYPRDGETVDTLLKHADAAMYEAKRGGRGTYRFFEVGMNDAALRTLQIQQALHEALANGYFSLHFQPKFRGETQALTGAEALIRLQHPKLGALAPLDFIPIAERSGQIVPIGYWVVRETCRQIRAWREAGLPNMKVAVNLSTRQLAQPGLAGAMLEIVEAQQVAPRQIIFEITETMAMQDAERTIVAIRDFQQAGFEIAIDDFGTGYSSLAYLQRFRVKQLKIDRFFTSGLDRHGKEGAAIVSAIIALAHSLGMDVVAEGVETATQLDKLKALMCDEMQGFLLGQPLTAEAFEQLIRERAGAGTDPAPA
ncbi:putative bifunctional diguanylate cyclase/phosphodiesterase [Burkholderia gladioli]|uniref:putative bifunctional diguanylate cyclase/phosphodiesterase n=1 Tax=Burkholderia gladioli TaxID=28095 RepID=UPI001641C1CE|nr:EAL domain-containing protein [Burkholderia gladioli]MDN7748704.1 EAL domain-containing protein [Burkholderia gladioli]